MQKMDKKPSAKIHVFLMLQNFLRESSSLTLLICSIATFRFKKVVSCTLFSTSSGQLQFPNYYVTHSLKLLETFRFEDENDYEYEI